MIWTLICPLHGELLGPRIEERWKVEELALYWCVESFFFSDFGEAKVGEENKKKAGRDAYREENKI